jgi:glucosamine--fructose-6-phosphate aminotransferase (isomerizing)
MLKEIHEEPAALRRTVGCYLQEGLPHFGVPMLDGAELTRISRVHIVACGTAMHAGLIGRNVIENLTRLPTFVEIASEFRYRDPILTPDDLVILLSQSGETADTLAALRYAKARGVRTLAVVNVVGSSVAREADGVLYTVAGPEIAVASTKAYSVQCAVLYLLAARLGLARGELRVERARELCAALGQAVPYAIEQVLAQSDAIRDHAASIAHAEHLFYIGRNVDGALCAEGSLKLKEISYIHSEAYFAGELKHGTISLIEGGTPVVAVMTCERLAEKTISGIREVRARGAGVLAILTREIAEKYDVPEDGRILLPAGDELLAPFAAATVLQLLAYHAAALRGLDVDKPRNLAKSVTVE